MIAVTYSSLSNVEWSECKLMWSYLILFRKFTNCVRKMVIRKMINTLSCIEHDRLRFPSFFGPLESSQYPSSCSIFFPWLSGFYRVVNHICSHKLGLTQPTDIFHHSIESESKWKKMEHELGD